MDNVFYEKCKIRIQKLVDRALRVNAAFGILRQIQQFQYEENEIINMSHTFYSVVLTSLIETLFVEINKMYETGNKNDSIVILLQDIKNNYDKLGDKEFFSNIVNSIFDNSAAVKEYTGLMEMADYWLCQNNNKSEIINRVKAQRDQYYAHLDKMSTNKLAELFDHYKVTYENMLELLTLNMNMCNAVYIFFCDSTVFPMISGYDDLKTTISLIKKQDHNKLREVN